MAFFSSPAAVPVSLKALAGRCSSHRRWLGLVVLFTIITLFTHGLAVLFASCMWLALVVLLMTLTLFTLGLAVLFASCRLTFRALYVCGYKNIFIEQVQVR